MYLLLGSQAACHPFPSGCLEYYGRVRASRFYCHREDPVVIFRERVSHGLVGCVVSDVVYKFDSFVGEMGMETSAGNVAVGKKREEELPVEVEFTFSSDGERISQKREGEKGDEVEKVRGHWIEEDDGDNLAKRDRGNKDVKY